MILRFLRRLMGWGVRLTMLGLKRGPHITRYAMYERLGDLHLNRKPDARVLCISGSQQLCQILGLQDCEIVHAEYPKHDLLDLEFADESFDYVVSDQVLEHVAGNPQRAVDESRRVLRPGGIAVHTTCFMNPLHAAPGDYWRFTPDALALLCEGWDEIVEVGGWGNPLVWGVCSLGLRFDGIPHARWHPMHWIATQQRPAWAIVTWVVARK